MLVQFLDDPGMDFATRCLLSGVRDGTAEVGEVLTTAALVTDGDPDSWLDRFCGLGRQLYSDARRAKHEGHRRTAWGLALRAANYLFGGAWWAPATRHRGEVAVLWTEHRAAWDLAVSLWPGPARAVTIPGPAGDLSGYEFRPSGTVSVRGTVMMVQGLDTPMSDAPMTGLSEGLRRGWRVVLFEGPGQGAAVLRRGHTLADGWDGIVAAAVEWSTGGGVPGEAPLVLMGVNHGSWFVLDAVVADPRLPAAALVLDPGTVDLAADQQAVRDDPILSAKLLMATGCDDLDGALGVIDQYRLDPTTLGRVHVPAFVATAQDAESFAGQGEVVVARLGGTVHHERFTSASGAGLDCEIGAPQVRNAAVYDWLDGVVAAP